jgi:adenylate cyclase
MTKPRSFQVHLITIFVFLISLSSLSIVWFTYSKNYQSILDFSKKTIERVGTLILQKVETITQEEYNLVRMIAGLLSKFSSVSFSDPQISEFLLNVCRYHQVVESLYLGFPDGSFLGAFNIKLEGQTHYFTQPERLLPSGTEYALKVIDQSKSPVFEIWLYKDQNLKTLGEEKIATTYDSTQRPWYQKAVKSSEQVVWTDIYTYLPLGNTGISVAQAVFDEAQKLQGVASIDLSLNFLSPFLQTQEIGKSGQAFILNQQGEIISPLEDVNDSKLKTIANTVFTALKKGPVEDLLFKVNGEKYLASIDRFPISTGNDWTIIVAAPLSDFFSDLLSAQYEAILISLGIILFSVLLVVYFAKKVSDPIVLLAKETDLIKHLDFSSTTKIESNIKEITLMENSISSMKAAIHSFSRYIPKEVVKQLIELGKEISLGGEKKEISVFFSDITGFSNISNRFPADRVTELLALYFDGFSRIILDYGGTIDKYTGDGIMAFWNAPLAKADHVESACLAAIECESFASKFNQQRVQEGSPEFFTRIGLNVGDAIVGNIGTTERMNYTALGDAVNIASRLEQLNKAYGTKILIRKNLFERLGKNYVCRPLDLVALRGISEKTEVYELMGLRQGKPVLAASPGAITLADMFTEAYTLEKQNQLELAKKKFLQIKEQFPMDLPTQLHLGNRKELGRA